MPIIGGKFASSISSGIVDAVGTFQFGSSVMLGIADSNPIFGSPAYGDGVISSITMFPKLRGPQVAATTLQEDRLQQLSISAIGTDPSIDLTSTGTTTVYTAPADKTALIFGVILTATVASNVTVAPQVSFGLNPSTTNVFAVESLIDLNATGDVFVFWANLHKGVAVSNGGMLDLDIAVAATASALVTNVRVIGIVD